MNLDNAVEVIKGIGQKKAKLLCKLGITSVRDFLYYMPRAYETSGSRVTVSALKEEETCSITAVIAQQPNFRKIRNGVYLVTFVLEDETGKVEAVFFNQPYMRRMYKKGDDVYVSGKVKRLGRKLQFTNPHIEKQGGQHEGLNAVYALTAGLTQKVMRIMMKNVLENFFGSITDIFPNDFRTKHNLAEINYALKNLHFPENEQSLEIAKYRLLFEELLIFNIALFAQEKKQEKGAIPLKSGDDIKKDFLGKLEFEPTNAQQRVMREIKEDLEKNKPMNRLLQGDVGSGKTMPAFYAMHICVKNNVQCVMMAPTEVLAKQHYYNAQKIFADENIRIELLTGSTGAAQRRAVYENTAAGQTDIVIGTHAVLYDKLEFSNLGLIITDEQHRFGVGQRAMLEEKSSAPHTLIMSATPIPRSLALILYGKTDISIIDELPPGRIRISTHCVPESKRNDMYEFIEKQVRDEAAQVFAVCPLVEQNDDLELRSSEEIYKELKEKLSGCKVALLHGRMKGEEKNDILQRFKDKQFDVLVSTTVIEVGVDVTAATIMVIENAERFGLAQLHQLRGRVGRSDKKSYCFLMCGKKDNSRLRILTKTNDGFKISEEDLKLRGPGQFLGSRQSGLSDLYMANLIKDMKLLKYTRALAEHIQKNDEVFYEKLKNYADTRFAERLEKTTIN